MIYCTFTFPGLIKKRSNGGCVLEHMEYQAIKVHVEETYCTQVKRNKRKRDGRS